MEKSKENIQVSVLVITYNHEKFIRECLDSIVCQKTNFKFEVIIHDDKSTDGSVEIIEEYKKKYPDLVVAIYEKENQYTKGKDIVEDCMVQFARGKYLAFCESDDKWCDENKLQKQYDFMETHPDYVACFHNTLMHDLSEKHNDIKFNEFKTITDLTAEYIFNGRYVHTTSYFIKKQNYKKLNFGAKLWAGDFAILSSLFFQGKIAALPEIMSIYNFNNSQGVMRSKIGITPMKQIESALMQIDYLNQYNEFTSYMYNENIMIMLAQIKILYVFDQKLLLAKTSREFKQIRRELTNSPEYKIFINTINFNQKIKMFIKYNLPRKLFIYFKNKG